MVTFKPIAITEENVTLPYIEGQYITAEVPFSDGATTYPKGVWVDLNGSRLKLTMQGEKGEQGEQGERGTIWFSEPNDPVAGNYNPNDMWLNTASGAVYTYKASGWELTGNIKGPQGEQGEGFTQQDKENVERILNATPSNASADNPLTTEDFVNSSINNMSAFYITYNANGDAFPTRASLINATTFYSGGKPRVPTQNDYATVLADESQPVGVDGSYPTTRYTYQTDTQNGTYPDGQWAFQYIVNNTTLTQAQVNAINSGITAELVEQIGNNTGGIIASTLPRSTINGYSVNTYEFNMGNTNNYIPSNLGVHVFDVVPKVDSSNKELYTRLEIYSADTLLNTITLNAGQQVKVYYTKEDNTFIGLSIVVNNIPQTAAIQNNYQTYRIPHTSKTITFRFYTLYTTSSGGVGYISKNQVVHYQIAMQSVI